jgi:putative transposase
VATVSRGTKAERFKFIAGHHERFGIKRLCRHLGVSRSGYHAWLHHEEPERHRRDRELLGVIHRIFEKSRGTYGSPRIHQALKLEGINIGRKRVERLMREDGMRARTSRVYPKLIKHKWLFRNIENKRIDLPKPTGPNQHWVADLTYIKHRKNWLYLAVVLDLYSRKVIGWSIAKRRNVRLTSTALLAAIRRRNPEPGLIFHTDRGVEYRSDEIQNILRQHGMIPSMNRPGSCTDNAEMESFFHTLKGDLLKKRLFASEQKLRNSVAGYINSFYNQFRLHSSQGYVSPAEYEAMTA